MTGYVLSVNNMGASIGAVASAIFPAIGAVLAYFFLKEEMQWYRWVFLILSLLGVYVLSWSPDINITYSAWAVVFSVIFFQDMSLLNPVTTVCTIAVLVFAILAGGDYKELLRKS